MSKNSARSALATLKKVAAGKFNEAVHPRYPSGHPLGGQFMKGNDIEDRPIPLIIPPYLGIPGRQTTTLLELSAIAADSSGQLTEDEVNRLHCVRNGFDSFEDFLEAPHSTDEDAYQDPFLYLGKRVAMTMSDEGEIVFTIDGSARAEGGTKPSEELIGMQSVFTEYLKSPASKRLLFNTPLYDTKERFDMRVKHYQKNGFISISDQKHLPARIRTKIMFLDNRFKPQTFLPLPTLLRVAVRGKEVIDNIDDFEW